MEEDNTMNRKKIVCMGMAVVDVIVRGAAAHGTGRETSYAESISLHAGGDALNQAFVLHALGCPAELVSFVGQDGFGRFLQCACEERGLNGAGLQQIAAYPTAASIVSVAQDAERRFLSVPEAACRDAGWASLDLSQYLTPETGLLCIGSMFFSRMLDDRLADILRFAHRHGTITCADMVADRADAELRDYTGVFSELDYALPSAAEAKQYTKKNTADEAADVLLALGVKHVAIKLGRRGVFYKDQEKRLMLPAYPANAVDTTGAGDNFMAGFAAALWRGAPIEDCLRYASAAAAAAVAAIGATTGVRNASQPESIVKGLKNDPFVPGTIVL